jgi:molybdate transport system ATP-binding protein
MSLEVTIAKRFEGFTLHADFTAGNTAAAILGASGCGKSMTLRCIAGVVKPDSGRIVLDGRVLFDSEKGIDLPPQQRNVGLLFQNYALFPNMTVEQNILCALKKEKDPAARKAACGSVLRAMRLEELAHRLPSELSGGQQQRAALARILAGRPRILMLDEPFSALDSYLREEVEGEVGSLLSNFDGTALLVTHDRDEAYRLCREMIVMDSGEVLRAGTTKEVFADPRRLTAARLTGCKNILPCTRVDAHSVRLAGCECLLHLAAEVPEGCTAVGIRAHDFAPCAPGAENALPVELLSASENPFDWNLIFQLPDGTTRLWWKVSKTTLSVAEPDAPACLSAPPERIMALVEHSQYAQ